MTRGAGLEGAHDAEGRGSARVEMIVKDKVTGKYKHKDMGKEDIDDLIVKDPSAAQKLSKQVQTATGSIQLFQQIDCIQDVVMWGVQSTTFIYTGNLLAPVVGGCAMETMTCIYQRLGLKRIQKRREEKLQELKDKIMNHHDQVSERQDSKPPAE